MANAISLRKDYVSILDEVYKAASKSAVLDSATGLEKLPSGKFYVPVITLQGLANHSRSNGGKYVGGDVSLEYKEYDPTYDRNRKFTVDVRDDIETGDVAFGRLAGEFIRTKVVPEIDAWRFAKYAQQAQNTEVESLQSGDEVLEAIEFGVTTMDEAEVPEEGRILFITPAYYNMLLGLELYKSQKIIEKFAQVITVPQTRFYEKVKLLTGVDGEAAGGYAKDTGNSSKEINFLIVHPTAVVQSLKHEAPKHIPAEVNQDYDGDSFAYRVSAVEEVFFNKKAGIYASMSDPNAFTVTFTINKNKWFTTDGKMNDSTATGDVQITTATATTFAQEVYDGRRVDMAAALDELLDLVTTDDATFEFIGWFYDNPSSNAAATTPFNGKRPIRKNTTLYARYKKIGS